METNNLTKSFGIRVPLDMYLKMIEVSAENKITLTDICLYSLANSGILKSNFNFKMGGATDQTELISKLRQDNANIRRTLENVQSQYQGLLKEIDKRVAKEVGGVNRRLENAQIHNGILEEQKADAEKNVDMLIKENSKLAKANELAQNELKEMILKMKH